MNYPDFEIEEAELETLCDGTEAYEIELEAGDIELEVFFDLDGNFLFAETELSPEALPDVVLMALANTYPDYGVTEAYQLEYADGTVQYEVELELDGDDFEVIIDAEGNVLCEDD